MSDELNEASKAIKKMVNSDENMEIIADMAKYLMQKYKALKVAGFDERQAMHIVCVQGVGWGSSSSEGD